MHPGRSAWLRVLFQSRVNDMRTTGGSWFVTHGGLVLAIVATVAARPTSTDEIEFSLDRGRVTLVAAGVALTDVLAEWSRVGQTRFVGADALAHRTLTLHLEDADEADAIRILLGPAAGYVAAARRTLVPGASRYDRVAILAAAEQPRGAGAGERPPGTARGGTAPARALPAADLQRLLDAVARPRPPAVPAAAPATPPGGRTPSPPPTAPFPGLTVEPGGP